MTSRLERGWRARLPLPFEGCGSFSPPRTVNLRPAAYRSLRPGEGTGQIEAMCQARTDRKVAVPPWANS